MALTRSTFSLALTLLGVVVAASWPSLRALEPDGRKEPEAASWAQWRGPLGTGTAPGADPPIEWSEGKNVRFKTELPGLGHSSPIVWGDRLFVTSAVPIGEPFAPRRSGAPGAHDNVEVSQRHQFVVAAIDLPTGRIAWQRVVHEATPHEGGHYTASLASASPVTDGRTVFAFFGSFGLYALDFDGDLRWSRQLGTMRSKHGHGEGSSPVLSGSTLVVNQDQEGQSFVVALDTATGEQRWRVERDEVTSWSTPIVVEHRGRQQVIVPGTARVRAYDLADGRVIWECGGLSANIVASPVAGDGMVFVGSSYDTRALLAIRLEGAEGDITGTENVVWSRQRGTPYVPSPLLYGGSLYFLRHYQGILSRVEAATGEERLGPFRLRGLRDIYASPVAAADRIYVTDRAGSTMVISHGDEPELLALNRLDDSFNASAAIVDDTIYLRGERHLYAIAPDSESR